MFYQSLLLDVARRAMEYFAQIFSASDTFRPASSIVDFQLPVSFGAVEIVSIKKPVFAKWSSGVGIFCSSCLKAGNSGGWGTNWVTLSKQRG